jgi:hypothetical protein
MKMWPVKMTGEVKKWPIKRHFWPVIFCCRPLFWALSDWWVAKFKRRVSDIPYYYLFKKFLVSDWLTVNCEIVISTQWLTKYGFFTFILAKWRQRVNMKKIWTRLRHITMTTRIILTRWRHWYDDDDGCRRTKELFFS